MRTTIRFLMLLLSVLWIEAAQPKIGTNTVVLATNGVSYGLSNKATGGSIFRSIDTRAADVANVLDYGATADDSTLDDAAFAAALAAKSEVHVPPGRYEFSGAISLATQKKLIGLGIVTLRLVGTNCAVIAVQNGAQKWHIENLGLARGSGSVSTRGIELLGDNKRWTIKRVTFSEFNNHGIKSSVGDISYGEIENCFFINVSNGSAFGGSGTNLSAGIYSTNLFSAVTISSCWFNACDIGVQFQGGGAGIGGIVMVGNSLEGCGKNSVGADSTAIFENGSNLTLAGNYFEANATSPTGAIIKFDSVSAFAVSGGLVGADISGVLYSTNGIIAIGRTGKTGNAGVISGVYFNNISTNGYFIAATNIMVEAIGNRFDFGGTDVTDATLAARLSGSVLVRNRGTNGAGKILAVDSTGKLEEFKSTTGTGDVVLASVTDGKAATAHAHSAADVTSGVLNIDNGTASLPAFSFSSDPNTGFYNISANLIGVATDGVGRFRFDTTTFRPLAGNTYDLGSSGQTWRTGYFETSVISKSVLVDDLAYNAGTWNGSTNVPTRNAVRDEMEGKAATSHIHAASDVTSETFDVARIPFASMTNTLTFALSDMTTALTTGTNKNYWYAPAAGMTVKWVRLTLATASSSGTPTVDINEAGTTILSTKLTVDASEWDSVTATAAAVISDATIAANAKVDFDIDVAGTAAAGAQVQIGFTVP